VIEEDGLQMLEALKFVQNTAVLAIERLIQKADP
jgi:hypothetical protein